MADVQTIPTYVGKVSLYSGADSFPVASTLYGTCTTAAATAAKVVTCADFNALIEGVTIHVFFSNANTAASPTLNVNSTGAIAVDGGGNAKKWPSGVMSFTLGKSGTTSYWYRNDPASYDLGAASAKGVDSSISSATSTNLPTTAAVTSWVTNQISSVAGGLTYQGTVSSTTPLKNKALVKGYMYVADTAFDIGSKSVEIGDYIIVNVAGTYTTDNALAAAVDVIQGNLDRIPEDEITSIISSVWG